jgi:hypothetical protein
MLMSFCIIVMVWRVFFYNCPSKHTKFEYSQQTSVTSLTSPHHTIKKVLKKEYSEGTIQKC